MGTQEGSVLSPFVFAAVIDVVSELAKQCVLTELLYADNLFLIE